MLLAVDIGNTDIVFALHSEDKWIVQWREKSKDGSSAETIAFNINNRLLEARLSKDQVSSVIISSVVPSLNERIKEICEVVFPNVDQAVFFGPHLYSSLKVTTSNPQEIGTDLMANAVAAYETYENRCIIVDFGTALTFTTIGEDGNILGVAIAPGLKTAMKCLSGNTAKLPEIDLVLPDSFLGKNTTHALQSGILHGYTGLVEKILEGITTEVNAPCQVIATGGLSHVLTPLHEKFERINPWLTLDGLRIAARQIDLYP